MLFGKYDFNCLFNSEAELPPYKGSTFRGAFGVALKKVTCALKLRDCPGCPLVGRCVYFQVFENTTGDNHGSVARPHPFVIEPPETTKTRFSNGDEFNFSILLFGFANSYLPYFIYAFEEMGKTGLGKRIDGARAGYKVYSVTSNSSVVYESSNRLITTGIEVDMPFNSQLAPDDDEFEMTIQLDTPLRLKFRNQFNAHLPFHVFVRAMLRRISSINNEFGAGEPPLDYPGLVRRATEIKTTGSSLEWLDWTRFSNRQNARMQLGGLVGDITYHGKLSEFVPLIKYCEVVHIGKSTTFGLGKIKLTTGT
ncbi:MAG: CRISPR system precrRNA processing endoribonuclease RAMP protein Cas6 [Desulfomonilaceae bacterium]